MAKKYYSLSQLAEEISVSDETIRRWIQNGVLRAHKLAGSTWRVEKEDWKTFLAKSRDDARRDSYRMFLTSELHSDNPASREAARTLLERM